MNWAQIVLFVLIGLQLIHGFAVAVRAVTKLPDSYETVAKVSGGVFGIMFALARASVLVALVILAGAL